MKLRLLFLDHNFLRRLLDNLHTVQLEQGRELRVDPVLVAPELLVTPGNLVKAHHFLAVLWKQKLRGFEALLFRGL